MLSQEISSDFLFVDLLWGPSVPFFLETSLLEAFLAVALIGPVWPLDLLHSYCPGRSFPGSSAGSASI